MGGVVEKPITWQHVFQYSSQKYQIEPKYTIPEKHNTALIAVDETLRGRLIPMRDWIHDWAGGDYEISGVYDDVGYPPRFIRFSFPDVDCAVLFKLKWI